MTVTTSVVWPLGPRTSARAERQTAGLGATETRGPASQEPATGGRPSAAVANGAILVHRPAPRRPEERRAPPFLLVDDATPNTVPVAATGWQEECTVPLPDRSDDATIPTSALLRQGLEK